VSSGIGGNDAMSAPRSRFRNEIPRANILEHSGAIFEVIDGELQQFGRLAGKAGNFV
jgi:hypothetical protein